MTGGTLVVDGSDFTGTTITNGKTVAVKVIASSAFNTATTATVTIGGVSANFSVTTETNDAPTADAGEDRTVTEGDAVTLSGSGTDPEEQTLTYSWRQTAGNPTVDLTGANTKTASFTAPNLLTDADLTFELTVSDGGLTATDAVTITVAADNDGPTASAGSDKTVNEGDTVSLSGSGSDPEGESLTYEWAQTGGSPTVSLTGATTASASFVAPNLSSDATLTFTLTVTAGDASDTDAVDITIRADAVGATLTATPAAIREGSGRQEITLNVSLQKALADAARVSFTIDPQVGVRDVDYTVSVGELSIPAGATEAETTLILTPKDNSRLDGEKSFAVTAQVGSGGTPSRVIIRIDDDETAATEITLAARPSELKAGTGLHEVTVTATLNGQVFDEDVTVVLIITDDTDADGDVDADDKAAMRDADYTAILQALTIPAGQVSDSTTVSITPLEGGNKKIGLTALESPVKNADDEDVAVSTAVVTLKDADRTAVRPRAGALSWVIDLSYVVFDYTAGTAIDPLELPTASGGVGALTYSVSANLPAGLSFDPATRTISGTPTAADTAAVTYTVADSAAARVNSASMTFTIEVGPAPPPTVEVARVVSTHSLVRENGGPTAITLTATLASASAIEETIRFTLDAPADGALAVRDLDYTAQLGGAVTLAAGETQGTTLLILTPIDNAVVDGDKYLGVLASASGGSAQTDIEIADDEAPSTSLMLSVSPHTVSEDAGATDLTVTATLDGQALDADATVTLSIDPASSATRDLDYSAMFNPSLVIPAGATSGAITLRLDPVADREEEGAETITLNGASADLTGGSAAITLADVAAMVLAFAAGTEVADQKFTAGMAIAPVELPAASGTGDITYGVSALPAGLSFDAATRRLAGTPEAPTDGAVNVTYTATDDADATASLTFAIEVAPRPMAEVARVSSTHSLVRENGGPTAITLTATLAAPSAMDETIRFTLGAPADGALAVRDLDYTAQLGGVITLAAGETQGTTLLTLTPIDNAVVDGDKYLGVQASASGGSAQTDIKIADDEAPSTSLMLSVSPHTVSEDAGATDLTVTATLDGQVLDADATVILSIDPASSATRDLDYSAMFNPSLVIPAGAASGAITLRLDPVPDREEEGDETIALNGSSASLTSGSVAITLTDVEATPLAFADGMSVADQEFTAGAAIAPVELPAASGGVGALTYSVSANLPAGLSFDPATRTLTGTPEAPTDSAVNVTYTATDAADATASLTFAITVNPSLSFGDISGPFQ